MLTHPSLPFMSLSLSNIQPASRNMASTCWVKLASPTLPFSPFIVNLHLIFAVTSDDQVKAYIKKIMSQLNRWMTGGKISKLVVVITDKETGEHIERWQFDVRLVSPFHHHHKIWREPPQGVLFSIVVQLRIACPPQLSMRLAKRRHILIGTSLLQAS